MKKLFTAMILSTFLATAAFAQDQAAPAAPAGDAPAAVDAGGAPSDQTAPKTKKKKKKKKAAKKNRKKKKHAE